MFKVIVQFFIHLLLPQKPLTATRFQPKPLSKGTPLREQIDVRIIWVLGFLLIFGLIMVYSSSIGLSELRSMRDFHPGHFLFRQTLFILFSLVVAMFIFQMPMYQWQHIAPHLFLLSLFLLGLVLLPQVGKLVNNARRWISLGPVMLQPSEVMKFAVIVYTAQYCINKQKKGVITYWVHGLLPMLVMLFILMIELLLQPDLGALIVICSVALGILFLGGSSIKPLLVIGCLFLAAFAAVIATSLRARRVLAFLNPWSPEFIKTEGYQLTNSLIAFGRGELFGVGLGNSVEKLTHLSEAHTDFILAIIAEELGFISVCIVVACYIFLVSRAFHLGRKAQAQEKIFESLVAQGIGLWLGLQSGVHLCVNAGALPTKGLTLPFISYGGSAMFMSLLAMAVLLRIDYEVRRDVKGMTV
jgi:cell division protein FtsW